MSPDKIHILCENFPNLYSKRTLIEGRWYFPFEMSDDGWFQIIYNLSEKLENIIVSNIWENKPTISQIKEKFGSLRWYMDYSNEEIEGLISDAEGASCHTCIWCGEVGEFRKRSWVLVLCNGCWEKDKNERMLKDIIL